MATQTKAQLLDQQTELEQKIADLQALVDLQENSISDLQAAIDQRKATEVPAARQTSSVITGLLTGKPVAVPGCDGLYKFPVQLRVSVNFGGPDKSNWDYRNIAFKTTWLHVERELAIQLENLKATTKWAVVRCNFDFVSRKRNVIEVQQKDYKTGAPRFSEDGQPLMTNALKYAPDMKVDSFDVLSSEPLDAAEGECLPF